MVVLVVFARRLVARELAVLLAVVLVSLAGLIARVVLVVLVVLRGSPTTSGASRNRGTGRTRRARSANNTSGDRALYL